jgi:hypothetical protein
MDVDVGVVGVEIDAVVDRSGVGEIFSTIQ